MKRIARNAILQPSGNVQSTGLAGSPTCPQLCDKPPTIFAKVRKCYSSPKLCLRDAIGLDKGFEGEESTDEVVGNLIKNQLRAGERMRLAVGSRAASRTLVALDEDG